MRSRHIGQQQRDIRFKNVGDIYIAILLSVRLLLLRCFVEGYPKKREREKKRSATHGNNGSAE